MLKNYLCPISPLPLPCTKVFFLNMKGIQFVMNREFSFLNIPHVWFIKLYICTTDCLATCVVLMVFVCIRHTSCQCICVQRA